MNAPGQMLPRPSRKRSAQDPVQPALKLAGTDATPRIVLRHVVAQLDALSARVRTRTELIVAHQLDLMLCETNCL